MIGVALWVAQPAGRGRAHAGVRHRPAAAGDRGIAAAVPACARRCAGAARLWSLGERSWAIAHAAARRAGRRPMTARRGVRGADGRLAMLRSGRDTFAVKEWLAADGDAATTNERACMDGCAAMPIGCIGRLARRASVVDGARGRSLRRGLRPRGRGRERARGAASSCAGTADRSQGLARAAAPSRLRRSGERLQQRAHSHRATTGPGHASHGGALDKRVGHGATDAAHATPSRAIGRSRRGRFSTGGTSPTSLPWMRTRFGGRMRTS